MQAYFLKGIYEDNILVFRSDDPEELIAIIRRLGASRDKQIRALAEKLEMDWYEREYQNKNKNKGDINKTNESRRISKHTRPKNGKESKDSVGD